jgi:hypothetical protein
MNSDQLPTPVHVRPSRRGPRVRLLRTPPSLRSQSRPRSRGPLPAGVALGRRTRPPRYRRVCICHTRRRGRRWLDAVGGSARGRAFVRLPSTTAFHHAARRTTRCPRCGKPPPRKAPVRLRARRARPHLLPRVHRPDCPPSTRRDRTPVAHTCAVPRQRSSWRAPRARAMSSTSADSSRRVPDRNPSLRAPPATRAGRTKTRWPRPCLPTPHAARCPRSCPCGSPPLRARKRTSERDRQPRGQHDDLLQFPQRWSFLLGELPPELLGDTEAEPVADWHTRLHTPPPPNQNPLGSHCDRLAVELATWEGCGFRLVA